MFQSFRQRRSDKKGFTLVELLVVIVILGILAAIVVFVVGGITDKGSTSASSTDQSILQGAEEAYAAQQVGTPTYTSEALLVSGSFLHAVSTKSSLCLATADDRSYDIIAEGGSCPAGYDFNGTNPAAAVEDN